ATVVGGDGEGARRDPTGAKVATDQPHEEELVGKRRRALLQRGGSVAALPLRSPEAVSDRVVEEAGAPGQSLDPLGLPDGSENCLVGRKVARHPIRSRSEV